MASHVLGRAVLRVTASMLARGGLLHPLGSSGLCGIPLLAMRPGDQERNSLGRVSGQVIHGFGVCHVGIG